MASGTRNRFPTPLISAASSRKVTSRISESAKLIREAEKAGKSLQSSLDDLVAKLVAGNLNPGIGTKSLGSGISYARSADGARVFFRELADGTIEILGKASKHNEQTVIDEILKLFGD